MTEDLSVEMVKAIAHCLRYAGAETHRAKAQTWHALEVRGLVRLGARGRHYVLTVDGMAVASDILLDFARDAQRVAP